MAVFDRLTLTGNSDRGHLNLEPMETPPAGANSGSIYIGSDNVLYVHDGSQWRDAGYTGSAAGLTQPDRTFSVVGDVHEGYTGRAGNAARLDTAFDDLATLTHLHFHRLYVGDLVDDPDTSDTTPGANDVAFLARADALDSSRDDWSACVGNHDTNGDRTSDQWATVYGYADQNYVRDFGWCRLIVIGADAATGYTNSVTLTSTTISWLDTQLAADGRDALILCHSPLERTAYNMLAGGPSTPGYSSINPNFRTEPNADVLAVLDKHSHARAWICGHTHLPFEAVGMFDRHWTGSRHIAHISASALNTVDGSVGSADDPIRSLFLTVHDDRIDIHIRNHRTRSWETLNGYRAIPIPRTTPPAPEGNPTAFVFPLVDNLNGETVNGAASLTMVGTESYTTVGTESGLDLASQDNRARIDPRTYLVPGQGSIIVRCTITDTATTRNVAYMPLSADKNRLFLTVNSSEYAGATIGGVNPETSGAYSISTSYPVPTGEVVTLALDWDGQVAQLRVNGQDAGSEGYTDLNAMNSILNFGGSSSTTGIQGVLLGVAAFRRPLTSQEHMRFVNTPSDEWTMDTVLG